MTKILCKTESFTQKANAKQKTIILTKEVFHEDNIIVNQLKKDSNIYNFKYLGKNKNNQLKIEIENYWSIPIVFGPNQQLCEVTIKDGNTKCN